MTGMIDLRSDTVTRPTDAMWDAMREASLGDDTLEGDATVQALEQEAADTAPEESPAVVPFVPVRRDLLPGKVEAAVPKPRLTDDLKFRHDDIARLPAR